MPTGTFIPPAIPRQEPLRLLPRPLHRRLLPHRPLHRRVAPLSSRRRRPRRRVRRWVEIAVCAAGAAGFLGAGAWQLLDVHLLSSRGVVVQARMIEEHHGRNGWIEVEFTTKAGQVIRGRTSNYTDVDRQNFPDVIYDPDDPDRFQAASWGVDYVPPAILLVCGTVLVWFTFQTWRHGAFTRRR